MNTTILPRFQFSLHSQHNTIRSRYWNNLPLNHFTSSIKLHFPSTDKPFCSTFRNQFDVTKDIKMDKDQAEKTGGGRRCCLAVDARHCMQRMPGPHDTSPCQLPGIFVPHYENDCTCFSCRWVRNTKYPFVLSKTELSRRPYPVVNPTHGRVPQDERQRLLTPVSKNRFQIMYIYSMELGKGKWGWVVVLPRPLLPFLLTDDKYSRVSRVARHPKHGWFGLKKNGQRLDIGHELLPPLYNPLYQHYGYHPRCSPYRLYVSPQGEEVSDNKVNLSPGENIDPPTQKPINSSSRNSTTSSNQKVATVPCLSSKFNSSSYDHAAPPVMDQLTCTSAFGKVAKITVEAQATSSEATSSNLPADQSTSDNDKWLGNPDWIVVDPSCANPPAPLGHGKQKCHDPSHNGSYYDQRDGDNRYTDRRNTTIFVGGLNFAMTKEELHYWFEGFGELMHVRKRVGQMSGFVQYSGRTEAEMAMSQVSSFRKQSLSLF